MFPRELEGANAKTNKAKDQKERTHDAITEHQIGITPVHGKRHPEFNGIQITDVIIGIAIAKSKQHPPPRIEIGKSKRPHLRATFCRTAASKISSNHGE